MPVMEMTASDQLRRAQEETAPMLTVPCSLSPGTHHSSVGQADHHLHREAVLLQVQACQLPVEWVLLLDL